MTPPSVSFLSRSVFGVAGALAISQALTGVAYILAARMPGPARFGTYATAIALVTVVAGIFDFGVEALFVREIAAGRLTVGSVANAIRRKRLIAASDAGRSNHVGLALPRAFPPGAPRRLSATMNICATSE
jgi:hypothetical protein